MAAQLDPIAETAKLYALQGQIEHDEGNREEALSWYEKAAAVHEAIGGKESLAHAIRHVADLNRELGHLEAANEHYLESLEFYRSEENHSPLNLANAIRGLALLREEQEQRTEARILWLEARNLYNTTGIKEGVRECEERMSELPD